MMNYKNYSNISENLRISNLDLDDFTDDEIESLNEAAKSSIWVKALALTLIMKINSISNKVKTEKQLEKKIDHLADLTKFSAALTNLNIATTTNDKSIFKKSK